MKITKDILTGGVKQTGRGMRKLVKDYYWDLSAWGGLPYAEAFAAIANIPFREDPPGHELIQRPAYTLAKGGDCDDKAICMASWAEINGYQWRFRAVGVKTPGKTRIPLTHVWTEVKLFKNGDWVISDCTYSHNVPGQQTVLYDRSEII